MSNPLYHEMNFQPNNNPQNAIMQNIADNLNYLKRFRSPQEFWATLQKENPQVFQQLQHLSQTIQNPVQYAAQALNQSGINLNQVMAMMQN
jgi:hypothetical protein